VKRHWLPRAAALPPRCDNTRCAAAHTVRALRAGFPTRKAFRPFAQRYKLLLRSARPGVVVSDLSDEVGGRRRACNAYPFAGDICGDCEIVWSGASSLLLCALLLLQCLSPGPQASGGLCGVEPSRSGSLLLSTFQ
jgi:hypothetical protein